MDARREGVGAHIWRSLGASGASEAILERTGGIAAIARSEIAVVTLEVPEIEAVSTDLNAAT